MEKKILLFLRKNVTYGVGCLGKGILGKLMLIVIISGLTFTSKVLAQSGTVTFTGTDGDNIGQILYDGTHSNDISGIQIDIFGAMTSSDATSRTNTGSFTFWDAATGGFSHDFVLPIDVTSGNTIINANNIPQIIVIMSDDGSEFSFESIFLADFNYGDHVTSKFEGFKNGSTTGSVNLSVDGSTYEKTFTTADLPSSVFGNVDEVRISNTNIVSPQFYAGFNNITVGAPVTQFPATQTSSVGFSSVSTTQMTISWTSGDGAGRAVFMKEGTGAITNPSDNTTYTASTDWTSKGTQLGSSGYYCVYNGTGTNVTVTGLSAGTQYTVQAYEYDGSAGSEAYNTSTATNNPNSQTTLSIPSVSSVSVPSNGTYVATQALDFTVNFDEAVTVNTGGGTPYIPVTLNTGGTVNAAYTSGSGTSALVFRYTVVSGNEDKDGVAVGSSITLNGGTIKSGSGINATLTLNSIGSTTSVLVDAIAPAVSSVSVPSNGTYITGQTLDFTVNFGEAVTVNTGGGTPYIPVTLNTGGTVNAAYTSGSGTSALVFRYTVSSGNLDNDGVSVGSAITANGGTLKDAAGNSATLTLNSVGSTTGVLVDAVAPAVSSVNVPSNGTYVASQALDFTVNFGEAVTVNTGGGTPYIPVTLNTGGTVHAAYTSGSGTTALVFRYTVVSGNNDNNGISVGASITANGGTLKDAAGNSATLTLNSVGSTTGVLVDAVAPAVTSVNVPSNGTYVASQALDFTVNFGEAVTVNTGGGTPYIPVTLNTGGTVHAAYTSGSGTSALVFRYTVVAGNLDNDGIAVGSAITANGGTLKDAAGNSATLTLNSVGSTTGVLVDAVAPAVSSVSVPSNGTYITGQALDFTVNFGEAVTVNTGGGTPYIPVTLNTGGTVHAAYTSGSGTSALVFRYTVSSGNLDNDGVSVGSAITANGGTLKDAAGNSATLTLNSVGSTTGVLVDAVAPAVSSVSVPSNGTYITGQALDFTVNFGEAVTVNTGGGTPYIPVTLNTGGTVHAAYTSGSGTSALVFRYTVSSGNLDNDGVSVGSAITANGGTLKDAAGNSATLTLNSVGSTTGVLVDAVAPAVSSVSVPSNGTYITGQALDFTVNFGEAVTVNTGGGTPYIPVTLNTGGTVHAAYTSGSGTSALVFRYTVSSGNLDNDGVSVGSEITANGGTLKDAAGNSATLTLNSVGSTTGVLVDAVAPAVTSVNVPSNGTYVASQALDFTVNFGEAVTVNTGGGTPYIPVTLNTGGTVHAAYTSGSGTSALVFRYTIVSDNYDNDGISVGSTITANGGTLKDAAGNSATLTLNSVGSTTGVLVDAVAPAVTSVGVPSNGTYIASQALDFTVNFGEAVTVNTGGGTPYIPVTLNIGGTVHAAYTSGSGSSALVFRYTIVSDNYDNDGISVGSTITANGGTLKDAAGNSATLTLNSIGSTTGVLVDAVVPTVTSVNVPSNGTYIASQALDFTVNFGEAVTVNTGGGTPYIPVTLNTGGTVNAAYTSGSGTTALVFRYTVVSGNYDNDGISVGTSIVANGGTLQDAIGNDAIFTLNSVGSTTGVLIDAVDPTILSVNVPEDSTLSIGEDLRIVANFSEPVTVVATGGVPYISVTLNTGGTVDASYESGSGTTSLAFSYTVISGNSDDDGVALGSSIIANGGTLQDEAGNNAVLILNNIGNTATVLIDGVVPTITSVDVPTGGTYISGENLDFTVNFSEAVIVDGGIPYMDISLNTGGTVKADYLSGSGTSSLVFRYTIVAGNFDDDGITIGSDISSNGGEIQDMAGNTATSTLNSVGSTTGVLIDAIAPTVTSVIVPPDMTYVSGNELEFTINLSEPVTVDTTNGIPYIAVKLDIGGTIEAVYKSGTDTTALTFGYTVILGEADSNGIELEGAIVANGGILEDAIGNNAVLTLNNIASTAGVLVDAVPPLLMITSTVTSPTNLSTVPIAITFTEPVTGFTVEDLTVTNGTVGNFSGSGAKYTLDLAPITDGTVTIDIAANVAQDNAGNNNIAAEQFSLVYQDLTGIDPLSFESGEVSVYPSVINSFMTIKIARNEKGIVDVCIIGLNGTVFRQQQYLKKDNTFSVEIDLGDIPAGVYLIEISMKDFNEVKRVLVQ